MSHENGICRHILNLFNYGVEKIINLFFVKKLALQCFIHERLCPTLKICVLWKRIFQKIFADRAAEHLFQVYHYKLRLVLRNSVVKLIGLALYVLFSVHKCRNNVVYGKKAAVIAEILLNFIYFLFVHLGVLPKKCILIIAQMYKFFKSNRQKKPTAETVG